MEPDATKSVSYFNVSDVTLTLASGEVIKESFLQEKKITSKDMANDRNSFIESKVKLTTERRKFHKSEYYYRVKENRISSFSLSLL